MSKLTSRARRRADAPADWAPIGVPNLNNVIVVQPALARRSYVAAAKAALVPTLAVAATMGTVGAAAAANGVPVAQPSASTTVTTTSSSPIPTSSSSTGTGSLQALSSLPATVAGLGLAGLPTGNLPVVGGFINGAVLNGSMLTGGLFGGQTTTTATDPYQSGNTPTDEENMANMGKDACDFFLAHMWKNEDGLPLLGSSSHLLTYHTDPSYKNLVLSLLSGAIGNSSMPIVNIYDGPLGWIPIFNPTHLRAHGTNYLDLITGCGGMGLPIDLTTGKIDMSKLPTPQKLIEFSQKVIPTLPSLPKILGPNYLYDTLDVNQVMDRLSPATLLNPDEDIAFAGKNLDIWRTLWQTALQQVTSGNPLQILGSITNNIQTLQSLGLPGLPGSEGNTLTSNVPLVGPLLSAAVPSNPSTPGSMTGASSDLPANPFAGLPLLGDFVGGANSPLSGLLGGGTTPSTPSTTDTDTSTTPGSSTTVTTPGTSTDTSTSTTSTDLTSGIPVLGGLLGGSSSPLGGLLGGSSTPSDPSTTDTDTSTTPGSSTTVTTPGSTTTVGTPTSSTSTTSTDLTSGIPVLGGLLGGSSSPLGGLLGSSTPSNPDTNSTTPSGSDTSTTTTTPGSSTTVTTPGSTTNTTGDTPGTTPGNPAPSGTDSSNPLSVVTSLLGGNLLGGSSTPDTSSTTDTSSSTYTPGRNLPGDDTTNTGDNGSKAPSGSASVSTNGSTTTVNVNGSAPSKPGNNTGSTTNTGTDTGKAPTGTDTGKAPTGSASVSTNGSTTTVNVNGSGPSKPAGDSSSSNPLGVVTGLLGGSSTTSTTTNTNTNGSAPTGSTTVTNNGSTNNGSTNNSSTTTVTTNGSAPSKPAGGSTTGSSSTTTDTQVTTSHAATPVSFKLSAPTVNGQQAAQAVPTLASGSSATLQFTITNTGSTAITSINASSQQGSFSCSSATLQPGATAACTLRTTVQPGLTRTSVNVTASSAEGQQESKSCLAQFNGQAASPKAASASNNPQKTVTPAR